MIVTSKQLRKEIKEKFSSLRAFMCEYVECLDEQYLVPPHQEAVDLIHQYWEPIKDTPWVRNMGDCDNRAIKLYSDVHWHRIKDMPNIPEDEKFQWSVGFMTGLNPFGNMHVFNVLKTDAGIFIFDGKIKNGENYRPLTARF